MSTPPTHAHTHSLTSGDRAVGLFALTLLVGCHLTPQCAAWAYMCPIGWLLTQCWAQGMHLQHCFLSSSKTVPALKALMVLGELALCSVFHRSKVTASIHLLTPHFGPDAPYSSPHTIIATLLGNRHDYLHLKEEEKGAQRV